MRDHPAASEQFMNTDQMLKIIGFVFYSLICYEIGRCPAIHISNAAHNRHSKKPQTASLFKEASNCRATQIASTALAEVADAPSNEPNEKQVDRANIVAVSLNPAMRLSVTADIEMHRGHFAVMNQAKQKSHLL
jgi:hypothetical protein